MEYVITQLFVKRLSPPDPHPLPLLVAVKLQMFLLSFPFPFICFMSALLMYVFVCAFFSFLFFTVTDKPPHEAHDKNAQITSHTYILIF